jgi:hypothetical protein
METAVQPTIAGRAPLAPAPLPTLLGSLWRDPHDVDPQDLKAIIARLRHACEEYPQSADLRTCLGMAHAVNYDAYLALDSFEEARNLEPDNFWAQPKFSELLYRLRALPRAEEETKHALALAQDAWQVSLARKQLQEIRRLIREGTQKPAWTKPLTQPVLCLAGLLLMAALLVVTK